MKDTNTKEKEVYCKDCNSLMVVREGQYGKFLACTGYPDCKASRPLSLGIDCPEKDCPGEIVDRKSKKGKIFYSCTEYPACKYVVWEKPIKEACPDCEKPYMIMKKVMVEKLVCADKECREREIPF